MRYTVVCDSDIGKSRTVNQDAVAVKHISTDSEEVVYAVLCDGMGGLKDGEVASSSVVKAFIKWFDERFSTNVLKYDKGKIFEEWSAVVERINEKIYRYGKTKGINLGTTVIVMLIVNKEYYILNIGDCRTYEIAERITQLTQDHSVVAEEVKAGLLTEEEARFDKRRNQLNRSIGVVKEVKADFFNGHISPGGVYLMCCDGVRNKIYDDELMYYFHPSIMTSRSNMENNIKYIFSLNMSRNETDNMTVVLIKDNETTIVLQKEAGCVIVEDEQIIINSDSFIDIDIGGRDDNL